MNVEPIIESGMAFGPYPDGHVFYIEKSAVIGKINKNAKKDEGVQIAELLLLKLENKLPTIWVIEAKSSSPQPSNQIDFDDYINEIREKLSNSLSLFFALYLKRHSTCESELSKAFQQANMSIVRFNLVLIINGHNEKWLQPLLDALKTSLKPMVKIWTLSPTSVKVLNDNGARELGLIE
jgi:hypothetical protein